MYSIRPHPRNWTFFIKKKKFFYYYCYKLKDFNVLDRYKVIIFLSKFPQLFWKFLEIFYLLLLNFFSPHNCLFAITKRTLTKIIKENNFFGPAVRVFANGPGDLGSIPGRVIPKTLKMELDTTLLNTQHYKVWFKGKVEQSWEWSSALPYTLV